MATNVSLILVASGAFSISFPFRVSQYSPIAPAISPIISAAWSQSFSLFRLSDILTKSSVAILALLTLILEIFVQYRFRPIPNLDMATAKLSRLPERSPLPMTSIATSQRSLIRAIPDRTRSELTSAMSSSNHLSAVPIVVKAEDIFSIALLAKPDRISITRPRAVAIATRATAPFAMAPPPIFPRMGKTSARTATAAEMARIAMPKPTILSASTSFTLPTVFENMTIRAPTATTTIPNVTNFENTDFSSLIFANWLITAVNESITMLSPANTMINLSLSISCAFFSK